MQFFLFVATVLASEKEQQLLTNVPVYLMSLMNNVVRGPNAQVTFDEEARRNH